MSCTVVRAMVLMQAGGMKLNLIARSDLLSVDIGRKQNLVCKLITHIFNQGALINMITSTKWRSST